MTLTPPKQHREIENVLLRVPSKLRGLVSEQASDIGLSQNAFMTNSILFGVLVYGERPYVGDPENLLFLVREIDRAHKELDGAVGGFHSQDWAEIEPLVKTLEQCDVLANLKVRPDTAASNTTVFSFTLTKNGRASWPRLRNALIMMAERADGKEELLPMA